MEDPPAPVDTTADPAVRLLVDALLYADLRRVAHRERWRAGTDASLHTTALVNEAYLKLAGTGCFRDRAHLLATAAMAMRQVLVSQARARVATKRGSGLSDLPIEAADQVAAEESDDRMVALEEALRDLEREHPDLARIVECRYFAGYTEPETATALGLSIGVVQRRWARAKARLYEALDS